jgi:hypothetical protein
MTAPKEKSSTEPRIVIDLRGDVSGPGETRDAMLAPVAARK